MSKVHKFVITNPDLCIACNACMKTCIKHAYMRGKLSKKRLDNLTSIKNDLIEVIAPLERFIDSINATKQINNPFQQIQKCKKGAAFILRPISYI